jgi:hypothetical protein
MAFQVKMDVGKLYSLSLGAALVFILTFRLCHAVCTCFYPRFKRLVIRLTLPRPSGRLSWAPKDCGRFALLTIYVTGTVASNAIHVSTLSQASSRAAMLCLANLVPLMVCSHEFGTHLLGMSPDLFHGIHQTLGMMAFLQGLAHGIMRSVSTPIKFQDSSTVFGVSVSSFSPSKTYTKTRQALVMFALLPLSSIFKSPFYKLFMHLHRSCALGLVLIIWRHISGKSTLSTWYVIGAASVYAVTLLIQLLRMAARNLTFSTRAECLIKEKGKNLEIVVIPARPWEIQAGERVNLSLIGAGLFSIFQMHPFVIAWWDKNELGKLESATLLVRPRAGFTNKLAKLSGRHTAWIDGPYGPDWTLSGAAIADYGHVFMVVTGIGIAAQIPHIKQLLEGCRQGTVRTRKIKLLWQLDTEGELMIFACCTGH